MPLPPRRATFEPANHLPTRRYYNTCTGASLWGGTYYAQKIARGGSSPWTSMRTSREP